MSITADSLLELARQGREAFESLADSASALAHARRLVDLVKERLRDEESILLLQHAGSPKALGPNEETRTAAIRALTEETRRQMADDEATLFEAQVNYDRDKLYLDGLKFQSALWRTAATLQISKADSRAAGYPQRAGDDAGDVPVTGGTNSSFVRGDQTIAPRDMSRSEENEE